MTEHTENQVFESEIGFDASVNDEVMRLYCPEYFDKVKPDYEWDEEDNLVAYVEFDLFPEAIFRQFVKDNYPNALGREKETSFYTRPNPSAGENLLSGHNTDEDNNPPEDPEIEEPISSVKKFIWAEGIFFEKELTSHPGDFPQAEVIKSGQRLKVRVNGKKDAKMSMLDYVLDWFEKKSQDCPLIKTIQCTCERCKSLGQPYEIRYHHFQDLQSIFIPRIQCYASGELVRLDEISSFNQPEVRMAVFYSKSDSIFFDEFYEQFDGQGDFEIHLWKSGVLDNLPINKIREDVQFVINKAHFVIFMISSSFDKSEVLKYAVECAGRRHKNGEIVVKIIQLTPFEWQERPLFSKKKFEALNSAPIGPGTNREEFWAKIARRTHESIEIWAGLEEKNLKKYKSPIFDDISNNLQVPKSTSPIAYRTVKIFLASSSELRIDRDDFDLYFRQQNDHLLEEKGVYLKIVRWENFLDTMSETRLQDEYNKEVKACDIFVSLFFTKTGKYTEEEFNVAYKKFKETCKPQIFTFFKKPTVTATEEMQNDLTSLWSFKDKLKKLGHFPSEYDTIEHLKRQFGDQLAQLLREGRI